jgi:hypothetical protein
MARLLEESICQATEQCFPKRDTLPSEVLGCEEDELRMEINGEVHISASN